MLRNHFLATCKPQHQKLREVILISTTDIYQLLLSCLVSEILKNLPATKQAIPEFAQCVEVKRDQP